MNKSTFLVSFLLILICFSACSSASPNKLQEITPTSQMMNNPNSMPSETFIPTDTREPISFPLAERGPYPVGKKLNIVFEDPSRNGREVAITIWYPALQPQDSTNSDFIPDAMPDLTNAPYPLMLSSSKVGGIFAPHLVSYGFVYVGINGLDTYLWNSQLIDQPLDILFALNQVASTPLEGLEGMIDAENAGVLGYSFDGYNSLALSGARVDPDYYLEFCANPSLDEHWIRWEYCQPANTWDEFSEHAGGAITTSSDGLWQPMTDERIRAVMPMSPDGAILFGDRGLSSVDRPTLIIAATRDEICTYNLEAVFIFEHIDAAYRTMISFVGKGHMMIEVVKSVSIMKHFATAFFGYYLQGRQDYAWYISEDFVNQVDDLAWGVYKR